MVITAIDVFWPTFSQNPTSILIDFPDWDGPYRSIQQYRCFCFFVMVWLVCRLEEVCNVIIALLDLHTSKRFVRCLISLYVDLHTLTCLCYLKAVVESKWTSSMTNSARSWTKLRNVVSATIRFRLFCVAEKLKKGISGTNLKQGRASGGLHLEKSCTSKLTLLEISINYNKFLCTIYVYACHAVKM